MRVLDIDKKLDMRLILRVRQNTELFNTTSSLERKLPVYVYGKNGETWISTYFPKDLKLNNATLFFQKFNASERENSYVIDSRINNIKDLAIIGELIELPSFVINRADISKGFLNIYSRFHSSQMQRVSDLLARYTSDLQNSRVELLGPSPGIIEIMNIINFEYPISLVTYELDIGEEDESLASIAGEESIIGELKNSQSKDGKFKMIVYSDHKIVKKIDGLIPISEEDCIYELTARNAFLSKFREIVNEKHIMRLRYFLKPVLGKLQVNVFVPSSNLYEYYSTLYEFERNDFKDITIRYLLPYSPQIWEFI
ncbi:MAG: hypothetical protein ACYCSG_03895 [Thermoplasmataceae archaeon]